MALSTRELYLALRVRDEGTRNLQRFAQEIMRTGTAARTATLKAQADEIREQAALVKKEAALKRVDYASAKANGASRSQLAGMQARITALDKEAEQLEREAKGFDRQATALQRNAQHAQHFNAVMTQTGVALETVGVALTFLGVAGVGVMAELVQSAAEYERQVAATATQVNNFGANMSELGDIGKRVAEKVAVPFYEIQPALFDIFSSLEVSVTDAGYLLEEFAKAAVAGQTNVQSASRATIGIMNAFNVPISQVNHLLDLQFQLVKEGIGSYEEWTARIGQVSPSAVRAGQSVEQMMAALATTTRFGIPAAQSATAVARAFDAMSNPAAIAKMESLGIKVRNAAGEIMPFNDIMRQFRDILRSMPEKDRVGVILDVFKGAGSTIQARKFLQSILLGEQGLELYDMILNNMATSTGSFEQAYSIMADTTAMKTQILKNKWEELKVNIGEQLLPSFNKVIDFLQRILDWFNRLSPGVKKNIATWLVWGSIIAIVGGILMTLVGFLAVFVAAVVASWEIMLPMIAAFVLIVAVAAAWGAMLVLLYKKSEPFRAMLKDLWQMVKDFGHILKDTASGIAAKFKSNLMPALEHLGQVLNEKIIPAFRSFISTVWDEFKPKLEEAGRIIVSIAKISFEVLSWVINTLLIPALTWLANLWNQHKEQIQPVLWLLGQVGKYLAIVAAIIVGVLVVAIVGALLIAFAALAAAVGVIIVLWLSLEWAGKMLWKGIQWLGEQLAHFGKWLGHAFDAGINAIGTFFSDTVPNFFHNVGQWLYDHGGNFIAGFIKGMINKFQEAVDTLKNFGGNLLKAFASVLGIGSPSKEMDKMGVFSAQGYINGYKRTMAGAMFGTDAFLGLRPEAMVIGDPGRVGGAAPQPGASMPVSNTKNITNNITINTPSLDTREVSTQLGWDLAGRM